MAGVFRYDGKNWKNFNDSNTIYRYDGKKWVKGRDSGGLVIKRANNSSGSYTQLYPSPVVAGAKKVKPKNSSLRNYKTGQSPVWQSTGDARQGHYNWRRPHSSYCGWLAIRRSSFGSNIQGVSSASLSAKRNGSGNYNNNQTITFRGAKLSSASGNPFGKEVNGAFTCTTGGPGANRRFYNRPISQTNEVLNWLKGANGADGLLLQNSERSASGTYSANYLGILDIELSISYTQSGYSVRFEPAPEGMAYSLNRMPGVELTMVDGVLYFLYLVTDDENDLTYEQIMTKRERNLEVTPTLSQAKLDGMVFNPEIISTKVVSKDDGPYLEVMVMNLGDKYVDVYSPKDGWIELEQRITAEGPSEFIFETKLSLDTDIFNSGDPKIRVSE